MSEEYGILHKVKEQKFKACENKVLPKRDKETGEWRRLHSQ
jgi:hypothetical protein